MTEIHLGLILDSASPQPGTHGEARVSSRCRRFGGERRLQAAGVGVWGGGQAGKACAKAQRQPRDCGARLCVLGKGLHTMSAPDTMEAEEPQPLGGS